MKCSNKILKRTGIVLGGLVAIGLVANAVSLETETRLAGYFRQFGGDLIRLQVARADRVGAMSGWRPAMPVTQWRVRKP